MTDDIKQGLERYCGKTPPGSGLERILRDTAPIEDKIEKTRSALARFTRPRCAFARMTAFFACLPLLAIGILAFLAYAPCQWHKTMYLFQLTRWPKKKPKIPRKFTGTWQEWHVNGKLAEKCDYVGGIRNGIYRGWHINGKPSYVAMHNKGYPIGTTKHWDINGNLRQITEYGKGKSERTEHYEMVNGGRVLFDVIIFNEAGLRHGENFTRRRWGPSFLKMTRVDTYKDGELLSKRVFYNEKLRYFCEYKNRQKHGRETIWLQNGKKIWEAEYRNEKPTGNYRLWNSDGRPIACEEYLKFVSSATREQWLKIIRDPLTAAVLHHALAGKPEDEIKRLLGEAIIKSDKMGKDAFRLIVYPPLSGKKSWNEINDAYVINIQNNMIVRSEVERLHFKSSDKTITRINAISSIRGYYYSGISDWGDYWYGRNGELSFPLPSILN